MIPQPPPGMGFTSTSSAPGYIVRYLGRTDGKTGTAPAGVMHDSTSPMRTTRLTKFLISSHAPDAILGDPAAQSRRADLAHLAGTGFECRYGAGLGIGHQLGIPFRRGMDFGAPL